MNQVHIALLRGINVGRAKRVAMADLRALVTGLGYLDVRTLLNSGNVIFAVPRGAGGKPAARIEEGIDRKLGVSCRVIVLTAVELEAVFRENSLTDVADNPSRLMVSVLANPADRKKLIPLTREQWGTEAFGLGSRAAYLWCPEGILESPLAQRVGKVLCDAVTTRNWATLTKLSLLAGGKGFCRMISWTALAIGYHLASRLAYVVGVGGALIRQDRTQVFTRVHGAEAGFRRFKRHAAIVMNNDAISFVVLVLLTRDTMPWDLPSALRIGGGLLGIAVGVGVKLWAAARLGAAAYYWHNFFVPVRPVPLDPPGPYRYLDNPMYTVGYLHAYGFALLMGSGFGLLAALFDQVAILVFHQVAEKPHFDRLSRGGPER